MKPLVLFIYKRPRAVEKVLASIPQKLFKKIYVVADGPKNDKDRKPCVEARRLVEDFAFHNGMTVLTNYSEENLGGPRRIPSGLDWVFDHEEEAIILEDDCVPSVSFYKFCSELLDKYRYDERIGVISGNNFQQLQVSDCSYYFSAFNHCWGWATWKRAWKHFDITVSTLPDFLKIGGLNSIFSSSNDIKYWTAVFNNVYRRNKIHWDYAWTYACWSQNYLSILPVRNLVSNIGFGCDATNTFDVSSRFSNLLSHDIDFPLRHPNMVCRNKCADDYTQKVVFNNYSLIKKIARRLTRAIGAFCSNH